MKHLLILICFYLLINNLSAQRDSTMYMGVSLSVGYINVKSSEFERLLKNAGQPLIDFPNHYIGINYFLRSKKTPVVLNASLNYNSKFDEINKLSIDYSSLCLLMDIGFDVLRPKFVCLYPFMGIGYTIMNYNCKGNINNKSLNNYLIPLYLGSSSKYATWDIVFGAGFETHLDNISIGIKSGIIVPFGNNNWSILGYLIDNDGTPKVNISYFLGFSIGFDFTKKITASNSKLKN